MASNLPALQDPFRVLDVYAGGYSPETPRPDVLATISAGYRAEPRREGDLGLPQRSTDGTIYVTDENGRADGLRAILAQYNNKKLLIAFPVDTPEAFVQQRFAKWKAAHLEAYGDAESITVTGEKGSRTYPAGTPEYAAALQTCKVETSVYFSLAEWDENGQPSLIFPDGLGFYRLRTASRNSLRNIMSMLRTVAGYTGGRLAGIPFELSITYRQVADGTGTRRTIPCWSLVFKPPVGIRLDVQTWRALATAGIAEGEQLMLPAPGRETLEDAVREPMPVIDIDSEEVARLEDGGLCDADYWTRHFFAMVEGSGLEDEHERGLFLKLFTERNPDLPQTDSLRTFLAHATDDQASRLIAAADDYLNERAEDLDGLIEERGPEEASSAQPLTQQPPQISVTRVDADLPASDDRLRPYPLPTDLPPDPGPQEEAWVSAKRWVDEMVARIQEGQPAVRATDMQARTVVSEAKRTLSLMPDEIDFVLAAFFGQPSPKSLTTAQARAFCAWAVHDTSAARSTAQYVAQRERQKESQALVDVTF